MTEDGETYTLGLLADLRDLCGRIAERHDDCAGELHELLRQIANPNLPEVTRDLPFRVELWEAGGRHVLRLMAACANSTVARAAFQAAIASAPRGYWTLRHGALIVEQTARRKDNDREPARET